VRSFIIDDGRDRTVGAIGGVCVAVSMRKGAARSEEHTKGTSGKAVGWCEDRTGEGEGDINSRHRLALEPKKMSISAK
jgi:hypothetical protein